MTDVPRSQIITILVCAAVYCAVLTAPDACLWLGLAGLLWWLA